MTITVEISDAKQIEDIERLRGQKTAEEFAQICLRAGLNAMQAFHQRQKKAIRFEGAKQEFKGLDIAAITTALKAQDASSPIVIEVNRLVGAYTEQLKTLARHNGNRLPARIQVSAEAPIEAVAFQMTASAIKQAIAKTRTVG